MSPSLLYPTPCGVPGLGPLWPAWSCLGKVLDAKNKLSKLEMVLEKTEADLALQLCEFQELRNLKLPWTCGLSPSGSCWRGTGFQDSSATLVPCAGRENSWTKLSQSCDPTRQPAQVSSSHPAQQSCKPRPGAIALCQQIQIRLTLEAQGVGIHRQTNITLFPLSTDSVGKVPSHQLL